MIESGMVDHWRVKYGGTSGPKNCDRKTLKAQVEANSVTLEHLSGAFILLMVGLMTGALVLAAEISFHYALKNGSSLQMACRQKLEGIMNWGKLQKV